MQYVLVSNGVVTEVSPKQVAPSWIPCGDAVQIGWLYNGTSLYPKIPLFFNASDWYWNVGSSTTQVYSSKSVSYLPITNQTYADWLSRGGIVTPIASEVALQAILAFYYPQGWLATPEQQAQGEALVALSAGIQIASVSTPGINGTYSATANSIANVNAIMTYILSNNTFPNGASTMPWADIGGAVHVFPNTTIFKDFATAFANYVTVVSIYGDSGGTVGSIPSNQIAIP